MTDDIPPVPSHGFATPAEVAELRATIAGLTAERDSRIEPQQVQDMLLAAEPVVAEMLRAVDIENEGLKAEIAALRAAPVAMRERAAAVCERDRLAHSGDNHQTDYDSAVRQTAGYLRDAIRALPLNAPAPVDPVVPGGNAAISAAFWAGHAAGVRGEDVELAWLTQPDRAPVDPVADRDKCIVCGEVVGRGDGVAQFYSGGWLCFRHPTKSAPVDPVAGLADPDMPADQMRMHFGEMTAQEMRTARAAIRFANSQVVAPVDPVAEAAKDALTLLRKAGLGDTDVAMTLADALAQETHHDRP